MILWKLVQFLFFVGASSSNAFSPSPNTPPRSSTTTTALTMAKHTLYDMPVSNNGARCRLILYKKGLPQEEVEIVSPMELGGLKSESYLKINPQGKMPALASADGSLLLGESDSIARYLMSTYATAGPSFQPDCPKSNLMARFHDIYITTIQGCLYKPSPPFGVYGTRQDALKELEKQLYVLEDMMVEDGLYLCGDQVSYADTAIFPTLVFVKYMQPKFQNGGTMPPKLEQYFEQVRSRDSAFAKVYDEVREKRYCEK
jgi:glutathione S-transferase